MGMVRLLTGLIKGKIPALSRLKFGAIVEVATRVVIFLHDHDVEDVA